METRRLGRTGHFSTVAILGGAAFGPVDQATADAAMERVLAAGVNHIDSAPSYGNAEEQLGAWVARERKRFFLGCKTTERSREGAAAEQVFLCYPTQTHIYPTLYPQIVHNDKPREAAPLAAYRPTHCDHARTVVKQVRQ